MLSVQFIGFCFVVPIGFIASDGISVFGDPVYNYSYCDMDRVLSLSLCIVLLFSYAAAAAAFAAPPIKGDLMTFSTFHCYNINLIAATATVYILHCTVKPLYGDINSPI